MVWPLSCCCFYYFHIFPLSVLKTPEKLKLLSISFLFLVSGQHFPFFSCAVIKTNKAFDQARVSCRKINNVQKSNIVILRCWPSSWLSSLSWSWWSWLVRKWADSIRVEHDNCDGCAGQRNTPTWSWWGWWSECDRTQFFFRYWYRRLFLLSNFSDTGSGTYFRYQHFLVPFPVPPQTMENSWGIFGTGTEFPGILRYR